MTDEFMDDPEVEAALRRLADAVENAVTKRGGVAKRLSIIAHTTLGAGTAHSGCTCELCRIAVIIALAHSSGARVSADALPRDFGAAHLH